MNITNMDDTYTKIIIFSIIAVSMFILVHVLAKAVDNATFQKVRENLLPLVDEDFDLFDSECCNSIAFQIENGTYSDTEFGDLSRECAIFILKGLAENMGEDETLSEYFLRKDCKH